MTKKEFLEKIENFLQNTGISATVFGIKAVKDSRLVFMLRDGRECREETQAKVLKFMNDFYEVKA